MIDGLLGQPDHRLFQIIEALDTGRLRPPYTAGSIAFAVNAGSDCEPIAASLAHLHGLGITATAIAACIRAMAQVASRNRR